MIAHSIPAWVPACLLAISAGPTVGQEWLESNRNAPAGTLGSQAFAFYRRAFKDVALSAAGGMAAPETRGNGVRHPNLLLNQAEIDQVKQKIRDHDWAARLLEQVKAKAEKDESVLESAIAYALTGQTNYAFRVRRQLLADARDQMRHYEELDVNAEPEWGRWSWWGATAWAYDLTYQACTADERVEVERWLRTAARTIIAQENVLSTTPNLVFDEHWRVAGSSASLRQ